MTLACFKVLFQNFGTGIDEKSKQLSDSLLSKMKQLFIQIHSNDLFHALQEKKF